MSGCAHDRLAFGSGDYYVFCQDCPRSWMMRDPAKPEYGKDAGGRPVGAAPELCDGAHRPGVRVTIEPRT